MNERIKAEWIKALTSGEYKQTSGALRDKNGFCCLGVFMDACYGYEWIWYPGEESYGFRRNKDYKGKDYNTLCELMEITDSQRVFLVESNERGDSFDKIAEWISNNL